MANKFTHPPPLVVQIEGESAAAIRREARRLDMPATSLARELLDVIAADGLVAAVLDRDDAPVDPAVP